MAEGWANRQPTCAYQLLISYGLLNTVTRVRQTGKASSTLSSTQHSYISLHEFTKGRRVLLFFLPILFLQPSGHKAVIAWESVVCGRKKRKRRRRRRNRKFGYCPALYSVQTQINTQIKPTTSILTFDRQTQRPYILIKLDGMIKG